MRTAQIVARVSDVSAEARRAKAEAIPGTGVPHVAEPVVGPRFARTRWLMRATHLSLCLKSNFPNRFKFVPSITPVATKIPLAPSGKSPAFVRAIPPPRRRGVSRSSRTLRRGCDGRYGAADERAGADGEIVRSRSPDAGIKSRVTNARRRWPEARRTEEITYKP
jgi:hypothetical protein